MGRCAKHIAKVVVFENTRCAAVVEDEEFFQLFSHGGHRQAVARAHIADHHIHFLALIQVAQLLHLFGRTTGLVHIHDFDGHAANAWLVVGGGRLAFVEGFDQDLGTVDRRNAKTLCRLAR